MPFPAAAVVAADVVHPAAQLLAGQPHGVDVDVVDAHSAGPHGSHDHGLSAGTVVADLGSRPAGRHDAVAATALPHDAGAGPRGKLFVGDLRQTCSARAPGSVRPGTLTPGKRFSPTDLPLGSVRAETTVLGICAAGICTAVISTAPTHSRGASYSMMHPPSTSWAGTVNPATAPPLSDPVAEIPGTSTAGTTMSGG